MGGSRSIKGSVISSFPSCHTTWLKSTFFWCLRNFYIPPLSPKDLWSWWISLPFTFFLFGSEIIIQILKWRLTGFWVSQDHISPQSQFLTWSFLWHLFNLIYIYCVLSILRYIFFHTFMDLKSGYVFKLYQPGVSPETLSALVYCISFQLLFITNCHKLHALQQYKFIIYSFWVQCLKWTHWFPIRVLAEPGSLWASGRVCVLAFSES